MDRNPEIRQMLNNPEVLRQASLQSEEKNSLIRLPGFGLVHRIFFQHYGAGAAGSRFILAKPEPCVAASAATASAHL
jgi:hypothetical protein